MLLLAANDTPGLPAPSVGTLRAVRTEVPIRSTVGKGAVNRPADVRAVQQRLVELGHDVVVDGRFGPAVERALKAALEPFQLRDGATASTDRLVPTGPLASYFFGVGNARLAASNGQVPIAEAVGPGEPNRREDVLAVQQRLRDLGFKIEPDGQFGPRTSHTVRLFASMVMGVEQLSEAPDRVTPAGACCACTNCSRLAIDDKVRPGTIVAERLFSADAPRWVGIPASGPGWVLTDDEGYNFVTDRSLRVVERAGQRYLDSYLRFNPRAVPFALNDASLEDGSMRFVRGRNGALRPEHHSHRNGLDIDVRLPLLPGYGKIYGVNVGDPGYDREQTYAIVEAFAREPQVERVLLDDIVLVNRAVRENKPWAHKLRVDPGHKNHIHVDVFPPTDGDASPES